MCEFQFSSSGKVGDRAWAPDYLSPGLCCSRERGRRSRRGRYRFRIPTVEFQGGRLPDGVFSGDGQSLVDSRVSL